jgi:predicted small integral membrane protein
MNIIIYTLVILTIFYFLIKKFTTISSKKISKSARMLLIIGLFLLAILFAVGGKVSAYTSSHISQLSFTQAKRFIDISINFII